MSFEPTEPQDGVDPNPFTLIDPEAIPYPLTDVWSLNYAAETLRSGGEDIASGAEDMRSTWQGLQAHYEAPESETLLAKMDPVVDRGDGLETDLATVAGALEDLAEAAKTARGELNTLRIEAQSLWNRNHDNKLWWLDKDDETDEWALQENLRLKSAVNAAWATFNEAENDCATRISNLFDGPAYASPDQASGDDVLVYGLPTDAGDVDMDPLDPELSFDYVNNTVNNVANWAREEFHPDLAKFDNPYGQAVWDTVITDVLWGTAVGFQSKLGFWHPDNGWRFDLTGRKDNAKAAWIDAGMDTAALVGIHDEHGWLWEPGEGGQEGAGAGWDRWVDNMGDTKDELIEGHTAWSTREDGVAYSNTTIATNAVMMTGGLPLKLVKIVVGSGVDMPSGDSGSGASPGTGSGGSGSESSDVFRARGGPGAEDWPSSPLPQDRPNGATPTTERFADQLTMTRESLLDPNQHRPTPSTSPDRPASGGDPAPQAPTTPHRDESSPSQEGEGSSDHPRSEDSQRRPAGDDQSASSSRREDTDAPRNPDLELETSTSKPRSGNDPQSEGSSTPRNEEGGQGPRDDGSDRQDDIPDQHHDNDAWGRTGPREETEQPTPATGSGGEGGGDQPPYDRTGTGDEGNNENSGTGDDQEKGSNAQDPSTALDPELEKKLKKADSLEERLRNAGLTDEDIAQLRSDHPRDGDQWQRAASALSQGFGKRVDAQLHPEATRFALHDAANPREFAYRYEYYKATFDELSRSLLTGEIGKRQAQQQAADQMPDLDVGALLDADHAVISEMRGGESAHVDTDLPTPDLEQAVRSQAENIEMGHKTATAYHARKHYEELPPNEMQGDVVKNYLHSAELTIKHGEISDITPLSGGAQKWTFMRPSLNSEGGQIYSKKNIPVHMRAFVIIRSDGTLVMPTYGMTTTG